MAFVLPRPCRRRDESLRRSSRLSCRTTSPPHGTPCPRSGPRTAGPPENPAIPRSRALGRGGSITAHGTRTSTSAPALQVRPPQEPPIPELRPLTQGRVQCRHVCPFAGTGNGVATKAGVPTGRAAPVALIAVGIRAAKSFKAFLIDRRELKCA